MNYNLFEEKNNFFYYEFKYNKVCTIIFNTKMHIFISIYNSCLVYINTISIYYYNLPAYLITLIKLKIV